MKMLRSKIPTLIYVKCTLIYFKLKYRQAWSSSILDSYRTIVRFPKGWRCYGQNYQLWSNVKCTLIYFKLKYRQAWSSSILDSYRTIVRFPKGWRCYGQNYQLRPYVKCAFFKSKKSSGLIIFNSWKLQSNSSVP